MIGLLLLGAAIAGPAPAPAFRDAVAMLEAIRASKAPAQAGTLLCWESDDAAAVVLVTIDPDGVRASIDGPRGPTIEDTLGMLPEGSAWYGIDPESVGECPVVDNAPKP